MTCAPLTASVAGAADVLHLGRRAPHLYADGAGRFAPRRPATLAAAVGF